MTKIKWQHTLTTITILASNFVLMPLGPVSPYKLTGQFKTVPKIQTALPNNLRFKKEDFRQVSIPDSVAPMLRPETSKEMPMDDAVNGRIVFQSARDGNWEIYASDLPAGALHRLTNSPTADITPRLSANGTQVAFASNRDGDYDIYVMDADGSNLRQITNGIEQEIAPSWSPSGKWIAFEASVVGQPYPKACYINVTTSEQNCFFGTGYYRSIPIWTADECCVYVLAAFSNTTLVEYYNLNGGGSSLPFGNGFLNATGLAYSPDGQHLALDYDIDGDGWNELVVDGQIVVDPGPSEVDAFFGSWSPDGTSIIYTRVEYVLVKDKVTGEMVYKVNQSFVEQVSATGGVPVRLFQSPSFNAYPDWRVVDVTPPRSTISQLPALSRGGPFVLSWQGSDVGPAGLAAFDVDVSIGDATSWTPLLTHTKQTSMSLAGAAGSIVYYRVRASDQVGNVESFTASGRQVATTTFYKWILNTRVEDVRGNPVFGAQVTISNTPILMTPDASDAQGRTLSWLAASEPRMLTAAAPGLQSPTPLTRAIDGDWIVPITLLPQDNAVINGSFETVTDTTYGWQIDLAGQPANLVSATLVSHYSGASGLTLGASTTCISSCLSSVITSPFTGAMGVIAGPDGTVQVLAQAGYYQRKLDGTWIGPETIPMGNPGGASLKMAVDDSNQLHILYDTESGIAYRWRSTAGVWSAPLIVSSRSTANSIAHDIKFDAQGNLHVVYYTGLMSYRKRLPDGTWQPEIDLGGSSANISNMALLRRGRGNIMHLIWGGIHHIQITDNGEWLPEEQLPVPVESMEIDAEGTWHAFWVDNTQFAGYYAFKPEGGIWSVPERLPLSRGSPVSTVDSHGTLYLVTPSSVAGQEGVYFRHKPLHGAWSEPEKIFPFPAVTKLTIDATDMVYLLLPSFFSPTTYRTTLSNTLEFTQSLRQSVPVPATAYQPTLFFHSKLSGLRENGQSFVSVNISDGASYSKTLTSTKMTDWEPWWIDVDGLQGKTVTVTFALHQRANEGQMKWSLDDVALGSWNSPVVTAAAISAQTMIVTGTNFISVPQVYLGQNQLVSVTLMSPNQLLAHIPETTSPGSYSLVVTNPDGQRGALATRIQIGEAVHLSVLTRSFND